MLEFVKREAEACESSSASFFQLPGCHQRIPAVLLCSAWETGGCSLPPQQACFCQGDNGSILLAICALKEEARTGHVVKSVSRKRLGPCSQFKGAAPSQSLATTPGAGGSWQSRLRCQEGGLLQTLPCTKGSSRGCPRQQGAERGEGQERQA